MSLRLVIADDHPLLIDGLKRVLEEMDDVKVVACVENGLQLVSALRNLHADIILLDLQMPKMDGLDSMRLIKKDYPKIKIIVFTNYGQPKLINDIRLLGADGYLLKDSTSVNLKEAVAAVAAGKKWFETPKTNPVSSPLYTSEFMKKYQLTGRETEIICRIAEGLTSKEIALKLFVSEFTINTHRRNICRKLNIYTPVGLLNFAKEHGLV